MIRALIVLAMLLSARPADACHKAHQSPFKLFEEGTPVPR